eukprot:TRINITY_DN6325_c0_g1_i1.p1 TRINITY_DN6325_c0_g1~~TRINITY_DN6325_c0_g1_i1.p1  ORF type:complete len:647 (-),score=47.37 TRINITY_DN6325_c0_g1_i1:3-1943(-)
MAHLFFTVEFCALLMQTDFMLHRVDASRALLGLKAHNFEAPDGSALPKKTDLNESVPNDSTPGWSRSLGSFFLSRLTKTCGIPHRQAAGLQPANAEPTISGALSSTSTQDSGIQVEIEKCGWVHQYCISHRQWLNKRFVLESVSGQNVTGMDKYHVRLLLIERREAGNYNITLRMEATQIKPAMWVYSEYPEAFNFVFWLMVILCFTYFLCCSCVTTLFLPYLGYQNYYGLRIADSYQDIAQTSDFQEVLSGATVTSTTDGTDDAETEKKLASRKPIVKETFATQLVLTRCWLIAHLGFWVVTTYFFTYIDMDSFPSVSFGISSRLLFRMARLLITMWLIQIIYCRRGLAEATEAMQNLSSLRPQATKDAITSHHRLVTGLVMLTLSCQLLCIIVLVYVLCNVDMTMSSDIFDFLVLSIFILPVSCLSVGTAELLVYQLTIVAELVHRIDAIAKGIASNSLSHRGRLMQIKRLASTHFPLLSTEPNLVLAATHIPWWFCAVTYTHGMSSSSVAVIWMGNPLMSAGCAFLVVNTGIALACLLTPLLVSFAVDRLLDQINESRVTFELEQSGHKENQALDRSVQIDDLEKYVQKMNKGQGLGLLVRGVVIKETALKSMGLKACGLLAALYALTSYIYTLHDPTCAGYV